MRIFITGPGGSGKSTLAEKLGNHYNTEVIYLDQILFDDSWKMKENYIELYNEIFNKKNWIIEGRIPKDFKISNELVDLIIIPNYNPFMNIIRIFKRYFKGVILNKKRIGINQKNGDKITLKFLYDVAKWRKTKFKKICNRLKELSLDSKLIELNDIKNSFNDVLNEIENRNIK